VSIGLAASMGDDDSIERIMKRADIALFEAKAAGRNRVRFYGEQ
jgi:PleD family two-component response regulator